MKYNFNVGEVTANCIEWIKDWFSSNGPGCNAVVGLSGGKDSTIVAALCVKALGPSRVISVSMPDHGQDINEADEIAKYLGIKYIKAPIYDITSGFKGLWYSFGYEMPKWSQQAEQNIPPRIRMTMLYAIAQSNNGRVSCNCNLSEDYIGYSTLFGDSVGSFAPISQLTVTELIKIGDHLGIPEKWVHKTPDDGLPHSTTDEEKLGFTYSELDKYIREGVKPIGNCDQESKLEKIERLHKTNKFKTEIIKVPCFDPNIGD